ncbi:MAG: hypothetical protein WJU30_00110 [Candidatus Phytoplasma pruni]
MRTTRNVFEGTADITHEITKGLVSVEGLGLGGRSRTLSL